MFHHESVSVSNIPVHNSFSCLENLSSEEHLRYTIEEACTKETAEIELDFIQSELKNTTKFDDEDTLELKALLKEYYESINKSVSKSTTLEQVSDQVSKKEPD